MANIELNTILLASLGFLIRWLFHLSNARHIVIKKRGDIFDWGFYFQDNGITMVLSGVCAIALLILIPIALEYFKVPHYGSPLVAFGCGTCNIEIAETINNKLLSRVKKEADKDGDKPA